MDGMITNLAARWLPRVSRGKGEVLADACGFVAAAQRLGIPVFEAALVRAADPGSAWLGAWMRSAAGAASPRVLDPVARAVFSGRDDARPAAGFLLLSSRRARRILPGLACFVAALLPLVPLALAIGFLVFIVPVFLQVYDWLGAELPWLTEMVLWASSTLRFSGDPFTGFVGLLCLPLLALALAVLFGRTSHPDVPRTTVAVSDAAGLEKLGAALRRGRLTALFGFVVRPSPGFVRVSFGEFDRGSAVAAIAATIVGLGLIAMTLAVGLMLISLFLPLFFRGFI